jgi:hypothetical protein
MTQQDSPIDHRRKVLDRRREERRAAETVANANFSQLMKWIESGGTYSQAAVEHLHRPVETSIRRRSRWICSRIGHLGRSNECECETCDRAWLSSYSVLIDRTFGLPPGDRNSSHHFPGRAPRTDAGPPRTKSALGSNPTTTDEWFSAVRRVTNYTGVETDCLRAWNKERGLVVRIDQKTYVIDSDGNPTALVRRFTEEWRKIREAWRGSDPPPAMSSNDLLGFLRAVYSDATQWGYRGESITKRRARRSYVNPESLSPAWRSWLEGLDGVGNHEADDTIFTVLTAFVETLRRACNLSSEGDLLDSPLHPVFTSLERAWAATRHEPVDDQSTIPLENIAEPESHD